MGTMSSDTSPNDKEFNEKEVRMTGPSLPERTASITDGVQRESRKGSLVASIKAGYGLADVSDEESVRQGLDLTHRKLKARHIQLIGIGGTIGTALFVQIGRGLMNGGPASLFLAFTIWCTFILAVTNCVAEMVTYLPLSSPFLRFADRYVDEAFGVAAGYNFFIFEAFLVPFEVVACNFIIHYWTDVIPTAAVITMAILAYAAANLFAVKYYGETEFWLALGKMLLIVGLIIYTFIVMLGGNPLGDRFGFRYWKDPGSFTELYYGGSLGRFMGFLQCLIQASFTIAGPDYVAMAAGEAENPRYIMPRAFKAVFYRLMFFFVIGSLCIGIVVPYDDPEMVAAFTSGEPGAAGSPYVVSMNRLNIPVLPHIVNAMVLGSAFSAGNSYCYCASRSLYGMALEGKAPKIFTRCTRNGVPIYCVGVVLAITLLSFPQVEEGLRSAGSRPEHPSLQSLVVTLHRLLRSDSHNHHDFRRRLHCFPARLLGHSHLLLQLHYGWRVPATLCGLEGSQEDKVA